MAKAWPRHIRLTLWDDAAGSTPLDIPKRRMWPVGIVFAVLFAIFASVAGIMIVKASAHRVRDVFDLMMFLFDVFWILGWSVGVVILGALTALLLLYRESARLQGGCLVHMPQLGPLKIVCRYELACIHNLHAEDAKEGGTVRIRFDYEGLASGIGDRMPRATAEAIIEALRSAGAGSGRAESPLQSDAHEERPTVYEASQRPIMAPHPALPAPRRHGAEDAGAYDELREIFFPSTGGLMPRAP